MLREERLAQVLWTLEVLQDPGQLHIAPSLFPNTLELTLCRSDHSENEQLCLRIHFEYQSDM